MLYMEEIFSISEDGKELLKCSPQAIGLIKILEGIETIKCNAFENCCDIEGVVIPSSVNKIEQNAFSGCINLKTISIPDSINVIPARCFENCLFSMDIIFFNLFITTYIFPIIKIVV